MKVIIDTESIYIYMVLQCINGVGSCRGKKTNLTALKSNSNTVWFNFQTYIYIYIAVKMLVQECCEKSVLFFLFLIISLYICISNIY